ncbi:hypothetical protein OO012_19705, partial [Rhodobacteraceae bacterium KMM 6894]|nr:hypothetical protein [Rhodobacteraceae bacterium KMM 6894]
MLPPNTMAIRQLLQEDGISEATLYKWRVEARGKGHQLPDADARPQPSAVVPLRECRQKQETTVPEMRRGVVWYSGFVVLTTIAGILGIVISMALNFQASPAPLWITLWLITLFLALLVAFRNGLLASVAIIVVSVSLFSLWWMSIKPTNQADWQPDVAQLLTGEFDPV